MKCISLHLPESYLKDLNKLVQMGRYPNRAEAVRTAVRDLVQTEFMILSVEEKGDDNNY